MSLISSCLTSIGLCKRCISYFSGIDLTPVHLKNILGSANKEDRSLFCGACLGLLEEESLHQIIKQVSSQLNEKNYESETFSLALSLPQCLILREKATLLYMKQNEVLDHSNLRMPLKDLLRKTLIPTIETESNKVHSNKSELLVNVLCKYKDDELEISKLNSLLSTSNSNKRKLHSKRFHKNKRSREPDNSFQSILNAVERLNDTQLPHYTECPPKGVLHPTLIEVNSCHGSLFIAGRYNKFSRELSQTPWFIDGVRKTESSVQELICDKLQDFVNASETKFLSSGREDVDVKMLGRGRPFAVELVDPKKLTLTQKDLQHLQEQINTSTELIAIRDLQVVTRDSLTKLKQGEEEKTKTYCAKIWCSSLISEEKIKQLNCMKDLELLQKTPLRVLHRRPIDTRKRTVHEMSMSQVDEEHYELKLKTQAGTYIKEFVHSDFGRTVPSLCTLLGAPVDILELDVDAVELDWPPQLND